MYQMGCRIHCYVRTLFKPQTHAMENKWEPTNEVVSARIMKNLQKKV